MCEHFFKVLSLLYYKVVSFHSVHFNKCACWKICLICECSDLPWLDQKLSHSGSSNLFQFPFLCVTSLLFNLSPPFSFCQPTYAISLFRSDSPFSSVHLTAFLIPPRPLYSPTGYSSAPWM